MCHFASYESINLSEILIYKVVLFFQGWTSIDLIEFMSTAFDNIGEFELCRVLRPQDYPKLCTACEMANYEPRNWYTKMVPAIERAPITGIFYKEQIDYALTLNRLGVYSGELVQLLLKSTECQRLYKNDPKLHEVYRIYGGDEEKYANWTRYAIWLVSDLQSFLGHKKVLSNVVIKDVTVPIVVKVNTRTGEFIKMNAISARTSLICRDDETM